MSTYAPAIYSLFEKNPYLSSLASSLVFIALARQFAASRSLRTKRIPVKGERVLIIGGTSGVGRNIAVFLARRGAKVCVIGRRKALLDDLEKELAAAYSDSNEASDIGNKKRILGVVADMTSPEELVNVRETLDKEWQGVDTVYICAGVSSLRPLLDIADSPQGTKETSVEGIRRTGEVAQKAITGNFTGPLLTAVTFIPQLLRTSVSPSIHLISSVAGLIPAPTRSLYCASKASSLMLFRALAIEHPKISFSYICPGTIEGNFRASAVDGGDVREVLEGALKSEKVAKRCIQMVDQSEGLVMIPWKYHAGLWLSFLAPWFTDKKAREKYNYAAL